MAQQFFSILEDATGFERGNPVVALRERLIRLTSGSERIDKGEAVWLDFQSVAYVP